MRMCGGGDLPLDVLNKSGRAPLDPPVGLMEVPAPLDAPTRTVLMGTLEEGPRTKEQELAVPHMLEPIPVGRGPAWL